MRGSKPPRRPGMALLAVASLIICYAALSHYSASVPSARNLGAGLSIGPVALIAVALLWRWTRPLIALAVVVASGAGFYRYWDLFKDHYEWSDLIQQCGAYGLVTLSFGRSLYGGRVPLCTKLAADLHGELGPVELRYTRHATAAWTIFYGMLTASIALLFFVANERVWSLYVNVGTLLMIISGCAVDFLYRHFTLPSRPGSGILVMLQRSLIG